MWSVKRQSHESRLYRRAGSAGWRCLLVFCALLGAPDLYAGAWVQKPNHAFAMVTFGDYSTSKIFNNVGDKTGNGIRIPPGPGLNPALPATYTQFDATAYLEYGLPFDFEIDLSFPFYVFARQSAAPATFHTSGIGDMTLGIKYLWFERPWLLSSVLFEVGIPSGNDRAVAKVSGQGEQLLPLGDGEWDYALRLIFSRSFETVPIYLTGDFGYRFRNIDRGSDDLPWSVEAGYTFSWDRAWFASLTPFLNFSGMVSLGKLSDQDVLVLGTSLAATGQSPSQELTEFRPGLSVGAWKKISLFTQYSLALEGKNTGAGWGIRTGFTFEI